MAFPQQRPRRLRRSPALRRLAAETRLHPADFIAPLFVEEGLSGTRPIESMPQQQRFGGDALLKECEELLRLGVGGVLLFGIPKKKDAQGSGAWNEKGVVPKAVRALKKRLPEMLIFSDTCLCEYTSHGHCGPLSKKRGRECSVDNDAALALLAKTALAQAAAGVDGVAPSDMMDGRVQAIRTALDARGFEEIVIMSYAVKLASAFYGPFRQAADSAPAKGDRKGYQMDGANAREALREAALDEAEGADILMVKPAGPCLDLIQRVRQQSLLPLAAYQVSGEYSMLHAASQKGWLDLRATRNESLLAIKRAGADMLVTYFAKEWAKDYGKGA
jgi:porphobilinogen synthase